MAANEKGQQDNKGNEDKQNKEGKQKDQDKQLSQGQDPKFLCGVAVSVYQNSGS